MKNFPLFLIFLIIFTSICYADREPLEYKLVCDGKEKTVSCVKNDNGILLLPLKEVVELIGYDVEECGRCGKDEIYSRDNAKALDKGRIYVNWFKNVITFSNDAAVVVLDAENERMDGGITYTSMQLYPYIGFTAELNEPGRTITMAREKTGSKPAVKQAQSTQRSVTAAATAVATPMPTPATVSTESIQGSIPNEPPEFVADKIIYAYDPSCASCKEVTALLKNYTEQYGISVEKINTASVGSKNELGNYYGKCSVPEELKDIYPILFIGNRYLFDTEITSSNIESLLKGENIQHTLKKAAPVRRNDQRPDGKIISMVILLLGITAFAVLYIKRRAVNKKQ